MVESDLNRRPDFSRHAMLGIEGGRKRKFLVSIIPVESLTNQPSELVFVLMMIVVLCLGKRKTT